MRGNAELQTQFSANQSYQSQISNVETLSSDEIKMLQKGSKVSNYELRKKR